MVTICAYIPVKNGALELKKCIGSLLSQSRSYDWIIVSDNCSSDDSVKLATRLLQASKIPYTIIESKTDIGAVENFKRASNYINDFDFIHMIAHDDYISPRYLETLVPQTTRYDFIQGKVYTIGNNSIIKRFTLADIANANNSDYNKFFSQKINYFIYGLIRARALDQILSHLSNIPSGDRMCFYIGLAGTQPKFFGADSENSIYYKTIHKTPFDERYAEDPYAIALRRKKSLKVNYSVITRLIFKKIGYPKSFNGLRIYCTVYCYYMRKQLKQLYINYSR